MPQLKVGMYVRVRHHKKRDAKSNVDSTITKGPVKVTVVYPNGIPEDCTWCVQFGEAYDGWWYYGDDSQIRQDNECFLLEEKNV